MVGRFEEGHAFIGPHRRDSDRGENSIIYLDPRDWDIYDTGDHVLHTHHMAA